MPDCPDCSCKDHEKCLRILNLILDNEASEEQEVYFKAHIEKCMSCFAHFNAEKQIRLLLKTKVNRQPCPDLLAKEIKQKISE